MFKFDGDIAEKMNLKMACLCQFLMDFRGVYSHQNKRHPFHWDTLYKLSVYIIYVCRPRAGAVIPRGDPDSDQRNLPGDGTETQVQGWQL